MSYDTTLLIVQTYGKPVGYWNIIASVDLASVAYGRFGKLIGEIQKNNRTKYPKMDSVAITTLVSQYSNIVSELQDGNIRNITQLKQLEQKLAEVLPAIHYTDRNWMDFIDDMGDLLIAADLADVYVAISEDNITQPYRRFNVAIAMLESFIKNDEWKTENLKAILWGH